MRKFTLTAGILLFLFLFVSCERTDYYDEITEVYREAERLSTSGAVVEGNMWSARSKEPLTWREASEYCHDLREQEHNDWRLPTIDELRTLIKDCSATETGGSCGFTDECIKNEEDPVNNCFEPQSCTCEWRYSYQDDSSYSKLDDWDALWSSIPDDCKNNEDAWYVNFSDGGIYKPNTSYNAACEYYYTPVNYVRCVR